MPRICPSHNHSWPLQIAFHAGCAHASYFMNWCWWSNCSNLSDVEELGRWHHLVPRKLRMEVCCWCGACTLAFVLRHVCISDWWWSARQLGGCWLVLWYFSPNRKLHDQICLSQILEVQSEISFNRLLLTVSWADTQCALKALPFNRLVLELTPILTYFPSS